VNKLEIVIGHMKRIKLKIHNASRLFLAWSNRSVLVCSTNLHDAKTITKKALLFYNI